MTLNKSIENNIMCIAISGRIDSSNSKDLSEAVNSDIDSVSKIILDLSDTDYLSSAALRIVLSIQQAADEQDDLKFVIKNPNEFVVNIFDSTGFSDFLTIEQD